MSASNRSHVRWIVIGTACLALGGCATKSSSSGSSTEPATSVAATPSTTTTTTAPATTAAPPAPTVTGADDHRITVNAVGSAGGVPDSVTITMGVETTAPTTVEVLQALSSKSDALIAYLRKEGVPEENLQTTSLTAYPTYGDYPPGGGSPSITGYTASMSVNVQVADLTKASTLIDGAAFAVGDALRLSGLSWSIRDRSTLLATARADAVTQARTQAAELAKAAGWKLGPIVSIDETTAAYPYLRAEGDMGGGVPFNPGTEQVQVNLTVVFATQA